MTGTEPSVAGLSHGISPTGRPTFARLGGSIFSQVAFRVYCLLKASQTTLSCRCVTV